MRRLVTVDHLYVTVVKRLRLRGGPGMSIVLEYNLGNFVSLSSKKKKKNR